MTVQFPNESPDYRTARTALLQAEVDLRSQIEAVAAKRRALPKGGLIPTDYAFTDLDGTSRPLSSLFGDHDTLAIYSLMYGPKATGPCPMCSAFLDGMVGQVRHISKRMAFAVVAESNPERLSALQGQMAWQDLPLLSAAGTSYQTDYLAQSPNGDQLPMMNIFVREGDEIRHFWGSEMFYAPSDWHPRHVDSIWPLWNLLDLTPQGRGDWMP
ncbi:DUF899 family protein [Tropicibacter sp. R16_0]|uniref:DUF899 family protein n=1 Tax=Tropicibacter sp. R16_0 TaxID=2821102 RepID=UPI001AD991F9|nr:DUF899 family protein [Tropicibacter sp. R16_0]MBO9452455.1 DUF899 family protein [Tropicibacter sp. R16_0]